MKANVVSVEDERSFSKLEKPKGHIWANDAPYGVIFKSSQPWKKPPQVLNQVNMTFFYNSLAR